MWENVLQMATEYGIWAVLFVSLFCKQLKESKVREEKYQATIESLADKLKMVAEIKTYVEEIRSALSDHGSTSHNE
ncbi:MAG: hypothetical protein J5781_02800 [Clostridia bacterium]|nr:hypothetical protein [Clostridia bacterium]